MQGGPIADVINVSRHPGLTGPTRPENTLHALQPARHRRAGRRCAVIGGERPVTWPPSWLGWSASCRPAHVAWMLGSASLLSNQTKFGVRCPRAVLHPSVCTSPPPGFFELFKSSFFHRSSQLVVVFSGSRMKFGFYSEVLLWIRPSEGPSSLRWGFYSFSLPLFLSLWLCWFSSSLSSILVQEERAETRKLTESRWSYFCFWSLLKKQKKKKKFRARMPLDKSHFLSIKSQSGVNWDSCLNKMQQFDPRLRKKKGKCHCDIIVTHVVLVGVVREHKHHHRGWRHQRWALRGAACGTAAARRR